VNVICLSDVAWNFLWQRQHQLVSRFPQDWQILYIEPSFWKANALKIINFYSGIKVPKNNNIIVKSIPIFPFANKSRLVRKINDTIIIRVMRSLLRRYHLNAPLLLIYNPQFSCILGQFDECLSCYEIIDEKLDFEAIPRWLDFNHNYLIRNVNLVTVSAHTLYRSISSQRDGEVFLIENGADSSHFKRAMLDIEIPNDIRHIQPPILGYIGAIGEWFDFTLLENILQYYRNISVVLIGWVFNKQRSTIKRLSKNYSNLYFLGRRSYDRLPSYVKAFTVCIIPFKIYKLTEATNPIKLYEYLAAGKPVISTCLPELAKYKHIIYVANDSKEFLEFIEKALNTKHDPTNFLKIASDHDWQNKVEQMIDIIDFYNRTVCK
jgi:glycosyltransferase involved in cell wall biosynthesis